VKELHGTASAHAGASPRECLELLVAVEHYPSWYPEMVRRAEVVERTADGTPARAEATLHVAQGPFVRDIELLLAVEVAPPQTVRLVRVPHGSHDAERFSVTWQVSEDPRGARIEVALDANLSVPRLVPLGGIGNSIAAGFVRAAARALER
jgi:hypothetical protein